MPDQDDFEPPGKCWKRTRALYSDGADPAMVATEVARVLRQMLRVCEGSDLLAAVAEYMRAYVQDLQSHPDWLSLTGSSAEAQLEQRLEALALAGMSKRVDAVLVRTARIYAVELATGVREANQPEHLAAQAIMDTARHCCLDLARAMSVGTTFATPEKAHTYYRRVIQALQPEVALYGRQLCDDSTGQSIRKRPKPRVVSRAGLYTGKLA